MSTLLAIVIAVWLVAYFTGITQKRHRKRAKERARAGMLTFQPHVKRYTNSRTRQTRKGPRH